VYILPPSVLKRTEGTGGEVLLRPRQGNPAASVDYFVTAILKSMKSALIMMAVLMMKAKKLLGRMEFGRFIVF
jgi:hypothetical protein